MVITVTADGKGYQNQDMNHDISKLQKIEASGFN